MVKASGLRWISLMWLGHIPWAGRCWALPFLTVLAPSERYCQQRERSHKKLTGWARQMVLQLRRWLPHRPPVLAGDSGYAVLNLLHLCQSLSEPVALIPRLRLDAALCMPAPPRQPRQTGRPRVKGPRLPTLKQLLDRPALSWSPTPVAWYDGTARTMELASQTAVWYHWGKPPVPVRWVLVRDPKGELDTQALLCTNLAVAPVQVVEWFVLRWQLEAACQEVRAHLGVETQRQWPDRATARTAPILMGLFSWIALAAHGSQEHRPIIQRMLPGAPSQRLPSPVPSPWCVATCGPHGTLFQCRYRTTASKKSPTNSAPASSTPSPMLLEPTKSS